MEAENKICEELVRSFPFLEGKTRAPRARRIFLETPYDTFFQVLDYVVKTQGFDRIGTITGLDEGENLTAIYSLIHKAGTVLSIKTSVPKSNPVIQTITKYYHSADLYERELVDLLGFKVEGLGEGNRYPLPDGWPEGEFPLRKDWEGLLPAAEEPPACAAEEKV